MTREPPSPQRCEAAPRKPWMSPRLTALGDLATLTRGGGGKLSLGMGDPGDNRKPLGQG